MWFSNRRFFALAAVVWMLSTAVSCTKKPPDPNAPAEPLAVRGKRAYLANCVSCHNIDPKKDGPIGPAVAGSSLDLLSKRILEGTYPEGYKPKRATGVMAPQPYLKSELEALEAYLRAPELQ